jgi:predicted 3-demethylubiquinone-9 3-methyltransferase (glyoxalase superfamily)
MTKIIPFLWFDNNCEEAMKFYVSVFEGSPHKSGKNRIISISRYEKGMKTPGIEQMIGKVLTGVFELDGQRFMALDGGPYFKFTEAISLLIDCKDQKEIDYFWNKLSAVPQSEMCGWVKDKYGLSWQICPADLENMADDKDKSKKIKVMNEVLKMKKIDIAALEKAANG